MNRFYISFLIITAIIFYSCKKEISAIKPELKSITESVYGSGIVKSSNQYNIFSSINGVVKQILVKEGDFIHKGDPIMIIQNQTAMLNTENAELSAEYNTYIRNEDKLLQIQKEIEGMGVASPLPLVLIVPPIIMAKNLIDTRKKQKEMQDQFRDIVDSAPTKFAESLAMN